MAETVCLQCSTDCAQQADLEASSLITSIYLPYKSSILGHQKSGSFEWKKRQPNSQKYEANKVPR